MIKDIDRLTRTVRSAAVLNPVVQTAPAGIFWADRDRQLEKERFSQKYNFVPREAAAMCVLLLRGPQTTGEIRSRTSRLCQFENLEAVLKTLENLEEWGLVRRLARLPGRKESRIAHRLGGDTNIADPEEASTLSIAPPVLAERIEKLELALTIPLNFGK